MKVGLCLEDAVIKCNSSTISLMIWTRISMSISSTGGALVIHVLPHLQDLIIKALVLFFMPFFFYSILYICVNAIWHEPPAMMTVSGRCDGSNMSVYLDSNLDLSSRIQGAGDYDADTNGKDLEFWQQVLAPFLPFFTCTILHFGRQICS